MRNTKELPDPRTWDFSLCPQDEVTACLYYECSREVPAVVEEIHAARSNPKLSKGFGIKYAGYKFPEFPGVPWLALDQAARKSFPERAAEPVRYGVDYGPIIDPGAINEITERLKLQYEDFRDSD